MSEALTPAPLGRRFGAGAVDALLLGALCATYVLLPLLTVGLGVPVWGVLAACVGYSVVPLAAFRATLGMKLFGLELVNADGHGVNPGDVLFRELVGRGVLPGAFLFTLLMGVVGSALGAATFTMPTGLGWTMAVVCTVTLALVSPGHLLAVFRQDGRSLADFLARSRVVVARPAPAPADEDERQWQRAQRQRRVWGVIAFEGAVVALGLALPRLLTTKTERTEDYAARLTRQKLIREFEQAPANEVVAEQLAKAWREAGQAAEAERVDEAHLAALLPQLGCDRARTLKVGERLNERQRFTSAIALVAKHEERCGAWPRLRWVSLYAHQQLRQWREVAATATTLIDDAPHDADYWWWRAEAYAELKEFEQAAADNHQSLALAPNGFAAGRYGKWARPELQRPCEGALALSYWMEQRPERVGGWAEPMRDPLYLAGSCDAVLGKGSAMVPLSPDAPATTAALFVGKAKGTAVVSMLAGYTLLTEAFASTAGVPPAADAPTVQVRTADGWRAAKLVVVGELRLDKATATEVRAAVVPELPGGVNAVLGVNFVWRFKRERSDDALVLAARRPVAAGD